MEAFYQSVAGFCFTLMGLWSGVVSLRRQEWLFDPARRRMAHSVYLGFFLPAVMSLLAAAIPDQKIIWQIAFFSSAAFGFVSTVLFIAREPAGEFSFFVRRSRWLVALLYALVAIVALFPDAVGLLGITLKPLQIEAAMLAVLVFLGVAYAWEFTMEPAAGEQRP
ncbi:MAG: hypothetical protein HZB53_13340 [Chloroflexi bacterium]|nr:hypothetical protein [Chloroflexota bacterium]